MRTESAQVRNIIGCLPPHSSYYTPQSTMRVNWIRLEWLRFGTLENEDISMWNGNDCYRHVVVCVCEFLPISWNLSSLHRFDKIRRNFFSLVQFNLCRKYSQKWQNWLLVRFFFIWKQKRGWNERCSAEMQSVWSVWHMDWPLIKLPYITRLFRVFFLSLASFSVGNFRSYIHHVSKYKSFHKAFFFSTNIRYVSLKNLQLLSPFVAFTWKEFQRLDELSSYMSSIYQKRRKAKREKKMKLWLIPTSTTSVRHKRKKNQPTKNIKYNTP